MAVHVGDCPEYFTREETANLLRIREEELYYRAALVVISVKFSIYLSAWYIHQAMRTNGVDLFFFLLPVNLWKSDYFETKSGLPDTVFII